MIELESVIWIIGVIVVIYILGRYIIIEVRKVERQKEFMNNMNKFDKKYKNE